MFQRAHEGLDVSLKDLARQGLISSTRHEHPISIEDLEALYAVKQISLEVLYHSLLREKWPWIQGAMKPGDLQA